nr:hypothetical protein [Tanacetum cinerariifolium]
RDEGEVASVAAMATVVVAAANKGSGCGGYDDEVKVVVPAVDGDEGKGRGGACYSGSGRSGKGECFWGSPEKLAEKVFRRRRWWQEGGDVGGEGGRGGGAVCVFHVYKNEMKMI